MTLHRRLIVTILAVLALVAAAAPAEAQEPAAEPEGAGNNLSTPVLWGEGATPAPDGLPTTWSKVALRGEPLPTAPTFDGAFFTLGADPTKWYEQQDAQNEWQADTLDAPDDTTDREATVDWVDWGDNLESKDWDFQKPVRVETVLWKDASVFVPALIGYEMARDPSSPKGPNEVWGANTVTYEADATDMATVYSPCARLTIQGPMPAGEFAWDPATHTWVGVGDTPDPFVVTNKALLDNLGVDGPGGYGSEVNVSGKLIYGYQWQSNATEHNGPGNYRLTFSLDGTFVDGSSCAGALNTDLSGAGILEPVEEEAALEPAAEPEGNTAVIDAVNNLTYIDVALVGNRPDVTDPAVFVTTPPEGATYERGELVLADYECLDEEGGSGIDTCVGDVLAGAPLPTATPGPHSLTVTATDNAGNTTTVVHTYDVTTDGPGPTPDVDEYNPMQPARLLDTRAGIGAPIGKVGPRDQIDVQVTGRAGVPASGVDAVVLNVTTTGSDVQSFVTVWPTGTDRPLASNLNTDPGIDTPNLVIAKVGDDGKVSFYNHNGAVHLVADVAGWFHDLGEFRSRPPTRILDTRLDLGAPGPVVGPSAVDLLVTGHHGVPSADVDAVVMNVTATESTVQSFVTVWPTGTDRPLASNLNTDPGIDTPNLVVVKVGDGGEVSLFNNAGNVELVGDLVGWFPDSSSFTGLSPVRLLDTRSALGVPTDDPLGPRSSIQLQVTGRGGLPATGVGAVVLNVTATNSSTQSFVTVWPTGSAMPVASNLNTDPGIDTPNLVFATVGEDGRVSLYNHNGTVDLVADLVGWFPSPID